jgi:hypothetical protein
MHATFIKLATMGEVTISHNSDWSGEAIVSWYDPPLRDDEFVGQSGVPSPRDRIRQVRIPGEILIAISAAAASKQIRNDLINFMEQWKGLEP